ncbi:hypothetical protein DVH05_007056 [Phytophthora capsici]|nr:hypothetical protein DVH05_007056 [Phytophthora capsici]
MHLKKDDENAAPGAAGDSVADNNSRNADDDAGGRSRDADEDSDSPPTQLADTHAVGVEIRLNGAAPKVGRPRTNRTNQKQKAKAVLKEYNQGMRLRGLLRGKDVCDIVACMKEIHPALHEVTSFMKTHHVQELKRLLSFTWKVEVDFVPEIVLFRLPEDVIREVFDILATDKHTLNDGQGIDETVNLDGRPKTPVHSWW